MIKVDFKENFSVIPNEIIIHPNLTNNAKLVWIYLKSKPNNWNVQIKDIQSNLGIGKNSVYNALNNLIDNQLMTRSKPRKLQNGQWSQVKYELCFELTTSLKLKSGESTTSQNPESGMWTKSHLKKVTTSQELTSISNTKRTNKKEPPTKLVAHSLRFYKTYGFPKKCNNQDKLINESADVIRKLIEIDGYSESEVVDTIRWAKENSWWSKNIISLRSLRDKKSDVMKFENLYNQFKADTDKPIKVDIVNQTISRPIQKPEVEPTEEEYAEIEKAKAEAMAELRNLKFGVN